MPVVIFVIFFRLQSQIATWALKCMCACLFRGQGIDLLGFVQYCMQSLGSFRRIPSQTSFVKLGDMQVRDIMASLAEKCLFAQNWVESFRDGSQDICKDKRVIWDHLLASKAEIIQKQGSF